VTTLVIENSSAPGSLTLARDGSWSRARIYGAGELATEVARAIETIYQTRSSNRGIVQVPTLDCVSA